MYKTLSKTSNLIGVHRNTILNWKKRGLIRYTVTPTGQFLYDITKYVKPEIIVNRKICYCRVSSHHQKDDLERQITFLKQKYPTHEIVYDIGSGLNFKRKNFLKLMDDIINFKIDEIVITYKDRLCRFGFDLVKHIAQTHHCKIIIVKEDNLSPEEEIVIDLTSIIHSFSTKLYGRRKYTVKQNL